MCPVLDELCDEYGKKGCLISSPLFEITWASLEFNVHHRRRQLSAAAAAAAVVRQQCRHLLGPSQASSCAAGDIVRSVQDRLFGRPGGLGLKYQSPNVQ